jgi:hypothetical protein
MTGRPTNVRRNPARFEAYASAPLRAWLAVPAHAAEVRAIVAAPRSAGPFQIVVQISKGFRDEMDALEADTYDPRSSSTGKGEFADAVMASRGGVLTLTEGAARYAVSPNGALHNSIDIWTDQEKQARNKANTRARLKGWIAEAKALDATITAALRDHKGA